MTQPLMNQPLITSITTPFLFHIPVNCYLLAGEDGFILIDTGMPRQRRQIEQALIQKGCSSRNLRLIILTHGDIDHCGNAAYFRQTFQAEIAMHRDDCGMVEFGDMFWNRRKPNFFLRWAVGRFFSLSKSDRFQPDLLLEEGDRFSEYGVAAEVVYLPGHSRGSIGILTGIGDLFCGDLFENLKEPGCSIINDAVAENASIHKLNNLPINRVYPGHGKPFQYSQLSIAN